MDLAAESRVKLARNNKVPRLRGRVSTDGLTTRRGRILYFCPRKLPIMTRDRAAVGFTFPLSILVKCHARQFVHPCWEFSRARAKLWLV